LLGRGVWGGETHDAKTQKTTAGVQVCGYTGEGVELRKSRERGSWAKPAEASTVENRRLRKGKEISKTSRLPIWEDGSRGKKGREGGKMFYRWKMKGREGV